MPIFQQSDIYAGKCPRVDSMVALGASVSADPDYIKTLAKGNGVTGDLKMNDGGKTWTVDTIRIPEFTFWLFLEH
ncbi:hypothetical protein NUU61_003756 [Penicillium alfredii]|uniref:Uncharacterized protein n=1 Tax=Penicillium alfredii TaxID=1506179 RepID=A0A9W9KCQ7_9EURO|nr:uncharacterized protein NUU61_003756 [Penicillium alfredii]KAJ5101534.1 hypothetical protein NUU61_003756 [Penicillium alfredii]